MIKRIFKKEQFERTYSKEKQINLTLHGNILIAISCSANVSPFHSDSCAKATFDFENDVQINLCRVCVCEAIILRELHPTKRISSTPYWTNAYQHLQAKASSLQSDSRSKATYDFETTSR